MTMIKQFVRSRIDPHIRDAVWAYRTRRDISVLEGVMRGKLQIPYRIGTNEDHLAATFRWLCAAQDASPDGGVAAFYDVRQGIWGPLYPETTGYIIPTFFDYADYQNDDGFRTRALRMADWLLTLQLDSGGFPIGPLWQDWPRAPIVFDTGQILFGLVRAYQENGSEKYLHAAEKACDWLVNIQDSDGAWRKFTSLGFVHTYNVRAALGMLLLANVSNRSVDYLDAAVRNLRWALTQQEVDGWYQNAGFTPGEDPLTHTIAYTIEGLLESGVLLSDDQMVASAKLAADALLAAQEKDGFLRARYGGGWKSGLKWSCLTGTAQMGMIWSRLYFLTNDKNYLSGAIEANTYIKRRQPRQVQLTSGVLGGISGSSPFFGDYEPYRNLNWAAKFFADSLLLEERYARSLR